MTIHMVLIHWSSKIHSGRSGQVVIDMYKVQQNFNDYVQLAVKHIQLGNVIALPTDTIYGLAANAQDKVAIHKLYKIKGREFSKPLSICVPNIESIERYAQIDHLPEKLLNEFLPGPVTIILNRTKHLNPLLNPTTQKVGIRIPNHDFVQQLTTRLNTPIALTSANKSNHVSALSVDEFSLLWNEVDAIFDDGITGKNRSGSTIIDLSEYGKYHIIRMGCYLKETLRILNKFY